MSPKNANRIVVRCAALFLALLSGVAVAQAVQPAETAPAGTNPSSPVAGSPIPPLPALPPVEREAFNRVKEEISPLTPAQIREMGRMVDDAERAAAAPPRFVPRVVASSVVATMAPGATPPVARLAANYVTTLVFMDQFGSPLRIRSADLGSPKGFNLTWDQQSQTGTNFLSLSPTSLYPTGNIAVVLEGVPVPVTLTLITGQREVDDRVDVRVRGVISGGAVQSSALPQGADATTRAVLSGVVPDGAKALSSSLTGIQAWSLGDRFYIRTPMDTTLLSPAYVSLARGPDGSTVYSIPPTPVLRALVGRDRVSVTLSGY